MPVPKAIAGFNVDAAVGRMLDQPELWWESMGLFVSHFSGWEKDWRNTFGNVTLERKKVHALRSAAANVGADQLSEVAATLEQFLSRQVHSPQIGDRGDTLRRELADAYQAAWGSAADAWQKHSRDAAGKS